MDALTSSLQALSGGDATGKEIRRLEDTASALGSPSTAPQPTLEDLPVELQGLILSNAPTFQSLSALVHASPNMHRVYSGDRLRILRSVLGTTLEGMLVDALGAHYSGSDLFQEIRHESLLWAFVKEQEAKYTTPEADWTAQLSYEDAIDLLHFHVRVIEPLAERYASWALASLPTESGQEQAGHQPLSDTERRRIQRAMYQLQLFCNVCGSKGEGRSCPNRIEDNIDRLRVLSIFPPWEIEQILCIHEFAVETYSDVFRRVAWDLNMDRNPKYQHLDITETIEDLMLVSGGHDSYVNTRSLNGVLRYGLRLLVDTIQTEDHEELVDRIRTAILSGLDYTHVCYVGSDWIEDVVTDLVQIEKREQWYSQRDSAQDFRHRMPFKGEKLDSPPLAWVLFWQGEYSNLIGDYIHPELRRWGYVMWDAARLGPRPRGRIGYWSFNMCGGGEIQDIRSDTYDDSVKDVRREDCSYN
ncbi:hypothetical protein F5883DRAFT_718469 [Diaporthe sp. PMI_573]|nr:hypothetical protein F5883DRAFT_718469 [Diaporthaceae sp. PMI_573]